MKKTRILIIDDDQDFRSANQQILEKAGFEVITADSGKKGLERAHQDRPAIVLCDVMLPDINGFSVCRELKDDPNLSTVPVIMMTAIGNSEDSYAEQIAKGHKADHYLNKPVETAQLVETINNFLSTSKPSPKKEGTKAKILLVDDDYDFAEATKQILMANRYDVVVARDGEEGIAKALHERPDLIILDVVMPGKDGFTVCYDLRKIDKTRPIPIIMLTAVGQQFSKPDYGVDIAIDHLADDFIDKPVDIQTLLKKIEKHITFMNR
jgi:DNA-binding response OmpR family regulator